MADTARTYIESVMARLDVLTSTTNPYKVGGRTFAEHDAPPIIKWRYGRITHEPATEQDSIANEIQELEIRVWAGASGEADDFGEENTRTLKNNLLLAARQIAQNTTLQPLDVGDWDWNGDAKTIHGRQLEGSIDVTLAVPGQTLATVVITATEHTGNFIDPVTANVEVVC